MAGRVNAPSPYKELSHDVSDCRDVGEIELEFAKWNKLLFLIAFRSGLFGRVCDGAVEWSEWREGGMCFREFSFNFTLHSPECNFAIKHKALKHSNDITH